MKPYRDVNGDSGVLSYDYESDWIHINFKYGGVYEYTRTSVGSAHLEQMKKLADAGNGLNAYINTNSEVKKGYSRKIS